MISSLSQRRRNARRNANSPFVVASARSRIARSFVELDEDIPLDPRLEAIQAEVAGLERGGVRLRNDVKEVVEPWADASRRGGRCSVGGHCGIGGRGTIVGRWHQTTLHGGRYRSASLNPPFGLLCSCGPARSRGCGGSSMISTRSRSIECRHTWAWQKWLHAQLLSSSCDSALHPLTHVDACIASVAA